MGVYATSQFLGAAIGGILGGWLYQYFGQSAVFFGCALLALFWLAFAVTMREPPYVTSLRLPLSAAALQETGLARRLQAMPGVADAVVVVEEAALYVKLDTQQLDRKTLERLIEAAPVSC
jgi:MFS family permease